MIDQVGDPMPGALDYQLDPAVKGSDRLLALAETALREACMSLNDVPEFSRPVPVYLALPELRPGFTESDATAVRSGLAAFRDLPIEISEVNSLTQGHAAGLAGFKLACDRIQQGPFEACLVGGVDSYFQPDTMEWLDENRQLSGSISRSGFVPGEAAGFCLLMTERAQERFGLKALARVRAVGIGKETKLIKTQNICLAEGLTAAVRDAVNGLRLPLDTINMVICDMNSERYRSEEWGFVCLRLSQYFDDPTIYVSPADCWGDLGAASGPLYAMLACHASARNYAVGRRTMLWASSESGLRAAAVLDT